MPSRIAYPGTEAALDALTTTNFDRLPGGMIGYAIVTANQVNLPTAVTDLTSLAVTVTVNSGRILTVCGHATLQGGTAACAYQAVVREGSTTLGEWGDHIFAAGSSAELSDGTVLVAAPSSGSHTYKLSTLWSANTNNLLSASATNPATIIVRDEGITF